MFKRSNILFIFVLILSFVFNIKNVLGVNYFSDDFNQNNLDNWTVVTNSPNRDSWKNIDNKLVGEANYGGSSFILTKPFQDLSDYSMRFDSINEGGVDQEIVFRVSEDRSKYYLLNIRFNDPFWPQDGGEIVLWKYASFGGYRELTSFNDLSKINLTQNQVHKIKIEANGPNIKAYFDSILVIDINDDDPILSGNFGFYNWGGNYSARPTKNLFDNLIVGDFNYDEPLIPKPKIIIVPGMGASWNTDAIVYDKSIENDQWKMTPFVKNYDGLIKALEQNGLKENEDFYVWNYDWRRPISEIVANLGEFINSKNIKSDEKIVLVGHSLGGLVSRIWAEDNKNDPRLKEVINLGSPNLGSADAYEVWNGGQISNLTKVSSIASEILLKIKGLTTKTDMEAVRKYIPSTKDLLPTFSFINKNGNAVANNKLETNNIFLQDKNNDGLNSGINLKLLVGDGFKTIDSINLKENNIFDKVLGIWPDGRVNNLAYSTSGDGTVLIKSANYSKNDFVKINSDHGEIVNKSINQIMSEIGLSAVDVIAETQDLNNNLVVFVGSPVNYSVKCDNESPIFDKDGFVVIKNKNYNSCNINLIATDNGLAHIVTGNTNNNDWSYLEKNITKGENDNIKINPIDGQIINNKDDISFLKEIIKTDINLLLMTNKNNKELKESLKFLDKNQPKLVIKYIFDFRKENSERVISKKIINNSTIWSSLITKCSKNEATFGFKIVDNYQNLINKLVNLRNQKHFKVSENAAISYEEMDKILKINQIKLNQKNYTEVCANNFTALNYGNEVLFKTHDKNDFRKWSLEDSNL